MRLIATGFVIIFCLTAEALAEDARSDLFSQQPGRYQIVINPQARADTFLLDTATGKVWQLIKYSDLNDESPAWQLMNRIDSDADLKRLRRERGGKKEN